MTALTMSHEFVISNPDGWVWNISSFNDYINIALTDETGDGKSEPLILTMTKEEAILINKAISEFIK
jgi:hypothetical protein